jgi:hypothetical protein
MMNWSLSTICEIAPESWAGDGKFLAAQFV